MMCLHLGLSLTVSGPGGVAVHYEPQVGHEPLEKHPETDENCVDVEGERIESFDGLEGVFVAGVVGLQVQCGHGGGGQ